MIKQILPAIRATLVLALLTGIVFPLFITFVSRLVFPVQAGGSLVRDKNGQVVGSQLLGQNFTGSKYFHPRPSAAGGGYAGESSGGTNLGPTSAKLFDGQKADPNSNTQAFDGVKQLASAYRKENDLAPGTLVPVDAVTRSGSGLDPHISIANALFQAPRVAKARNLATTDVVAIVNRHIEERDLGFLGEPRINVLMLNLALDESKR